LYLAGLDARGANLEALDGIAYGRFEGLQIGEPTSLAMRVKVRTEESILLTNLRTFSADVTTLRHNTFSCFTRQKYPALRAGMQERNCIMLHICSEGICKDCNSWTLIGVICPKGGK